MISKNGGQPATLFASPPQCYSPAKPRRERDAAINARGTAVAEAVGWIDLVNVH